jgi:hypothetical protein
VALSVGGGIEGIGGRATVLVTFDSDDIEIRMFDIML